MPRFTNKKIKIHKQITYIMVVSMWFPDKLIKLNDYVEDMKEEQKEIYFIAGQNNQIVSNSPFLENMRLNGIDVLYFTDIISIKKFKIRYLQF